VCVTKLRLNRLNAPEPVHLGHTRHEATLQFRLRAALWLDAWEFIVRRHAAAPLLEVLDSDPYCRPQAVVCIR
jgi:hypothetical protein